MTISTTAERRQGAYIRAEQMRYRKLDRLRLHFMPQATLRGLEPKEYKQEAYKLGLHAMQADEITRRLTQLGEMERELTSGEWLEKNRVFLDYFR